MAFDTNKVSAVFGRRSTGKTTYIKGDKALGIAGLINTYLNKGMKVLIIDTIDHQSYRDIPILNIDKIPLWKKGVYRIWVKSYEMPELIKILNESVSIWNSLLIFEDAYKHQKEQIDKSLMDLIIDSKQKNIDIIFFYHSFSMAPKDLYRMIDLIELFKTKDSPKVRKDDMIGYYDDVVRLYNEVNKHPSNYFHRLIDTEL